MVLFTLLFLKSTLIASRRMHCRVQGKVNVPIIMQQTKTSSSKDEEKWQHLRCIPKQGQEDLLMHWIAWVLRERTRWRLISRFSIHLVPLTDVGENGENIWLNINFRHSNSKIQKEADYTNENPLKRLGQDIPFWESSLYTYLKPWVD